MSRAAKTLPTMTLLKLMIAHVPDRFALGLRLVVCKMDVIVGWGGVGGIK